MARQLRIEYAGAFYHVTSRGNGKNAIFLSDEDRRYCLKCLQDAYERFSCIIHVYCLMENHYHLFIETPHAGLSRIMHFINTAYSVYFNKKHGRCGHPFQGRYKAILVQAEEYAREVAPYIHLNPVRASIAKRPEEYVWSNYRDYLGLAVPPPWTSISFILGLFAPTEAKARRRYEEYVLWRQTQKLPSPLRAARRTGILGTPDFSEKVRKNAPATDVAAANRELPQLKKVRPKPDLSMILSSAEESLGRTNKYAKKSAILVSHRNTAWTLRELGDFYDLSISAISQTCRRMERELRFNSSLAQAVREIERRVFG